MGTGRIRQETGTGGVEMSMSEFWMLVILANIAMWSIYILAAA